MSSPWRRAENASPSTRSLRDDGRHRRSAQHSPYRQKADTVSSSVWDEFSRLYIDEERDFNKVLDEQVAEQERLHRAALAIAAAEHERVRESAERARERVELEIERERKRREEDEMRALDAARREKAEREAEERQRMKQELERQEAEQRKRAEEERELEQARARLAEQKQKDDAEAAQRRKEKEEAERRAKEAKEEQEKATVNGISSTTPAQPPQQVAAPVPTPSTQPVPAPATVDAKTHAHPAPPSQSLTAPSTASAPPVSAPVANTAQAISGNETLHRRYLDLHKRLKDMRKYVITECKKDPALKKQIGDWRRKITQTIGQLTTEKGGNRKPLLDITRTLQEAQKFAQPSVDVSSYIISSPTDGSPIHMSGPFVYLLNIVSKSVISQLINEASVSPKIAEPIGIMAVSVFAQPMFKAGNTISLIDILLAKYHAVCPVLWGIYGNEKTVQGRNRIGWWKEDGNWVVEQRHIERMTGLAAGYGALSLRDFSRSKNDNPYPPSNYWKTLSYIVNTPPSETQPTHFYVLKALVDGYIPKFVGFYGQAGLVALRKALVEFPAQAQRSPARDAVLVMPQAIRRDLAVTL